MAARDWRLTQVLFWVFLVTWAGCSVAVLPFGLWAATNPEGWREPHYPIEAAVWAVVLLNQPAGWLSVGVSHTPIRDPQIWFAVFWAIAGAVGFVQWFIVVPVIARLLVSLRARRKLRTSSYVGQPQRPSV
jgi:hypothetical protein